MESRGNMRIALSNACPPYIRLSHEIHAGLKPMALFAVDAYTWSTAIKSIDFEEYAGPENIREQSAGCPRRDCIWRR